MLLLVMLAGLDSTHFGACAADDAGECLSLAREADQASPDALQLYRRACDLGSAGGCEGAATLLDGLDDDLAFTLRRRAEELRAHPGSNGAAPVTATEELRHEPPPVGASRAGFVGVFGIFAGSANFGLIGGAGLRIGLLEPKPDTFQFMPAIALVGGAVVGVTGVDGWLETRLEVMGVGGAPLLQPSFHGYISTGVTFVRPFQQPLASSPLVASTLPVRPYAGLGTGWNWAPRGSGGGWFSGGDAKGAIALAVVMAFVLAGRVELRVTPQLKPGEGSAFSVVFGVGL